MVSNLSLKPKPCMKWMKEMKQAVHFQSLVCHITQKKEEKIVIVLQVEVIRDH